MSGSLRDGAPKRRVGILISGRGSNMAALLDAARDPDFPAEIVLVLANNQDAGGLATAAAHGVPTAVVDHRPFKRDREAFERQITERLVAAGVELTCLAGFMRVLTPSFVSHWYGRLINIHPSLLPAFPGLHTHARALAGGVLLHGCTVHFVSHELDAGPIIAQAAVPVQFDDTEDSLSARVLEAEHRLYPLALALVASGAATLDGDKVTYADAAAMTAARLTGAAA